MIRGQCRGCGAEIIWATSKNGKPMPLSAQSEEKRAVLVDEMQRPTSDPQRAHMAVIESVFRSHFADCPAADRFRKAPKPESGKSSDE